MRDEVDGDLDTKKDEACAPVRLKKHEGECSTTFVWHADIYAWAKDECNCLSIRDSGSDLYVGMDMVKRKLYCLYKWYGRCSAKKGHSFGIVHLPPWL